MRSMEGGDYAAVSIAEATDNLNGDTQEDAALNTDNQTEGDVQPNPQSDSQSDVNMVKTEAGASAGDQQQTGDQVKMEEDGEESEDEDALLGDGEEKMEADMEEKLKIEGDHDDEEHKDEGPKVGKTWEKIGELKDGVQEKLKEILPAAFKSVRKLTVNIGPIKLVDLKSPGLHTILSLTTHFEMTYDKQKNEEGVGQERIRRFSYIEYDGYVKMRFEVTTPQFFVLVYNKLTNLTINGRNMSVKLPEQFEETLKEAKEYRKKREEIYKELRNETIKLRMDEKKRSVYLRNITEKVDSEQLKTLFTNVEEIYGPMKLGGGEARGATLVYPTREEAIQCVESNSELEIDEKKVKILLVISEKQEASIEAQKKEQELGGKKKKKKKKKGGAEGGGSQQANTGGRERHDSGGGGAGRKRRRRNRGGYDEGRYDMPFPYPQGDSDPVTMISMLRSTLARMEDNLGGPRGGYMDGGRGGMGYGGGRMYDDDFGGGGGRFMGQGQGFGNRPSLLGEPPAFAGFGGGMLGGGMGGFGQPGFGNTQFGGSYSTGGMGMGGGGGGRNRKRNRNKNKN